MSLNRYDILGVKPDAPQDEIKKAYRALAAKTHPDVAGDVMKPLFMSVQDAYETLSVPGKRAAYDLEIGVAAAVPKPAKKPPAPAQPQPQPAPSRPASPPPPSAEETAEADAWEETRRRKETRNRWIIIGLITAGLIGIGGYWIFQIIQIWHLVPPEDGFKLWSPVGAPAVVYGILWAFSTLVAAVAEDGVTAFWTPIWCVPIAGAFAFVTATGSPEIWWPALITGLVFTAAIAAVVRLRDW